jgi:hypothetical protein
VLIHTKKVNAPAPELLRVRRETARVFKATMRYDAPLNPFAPSLLTITVIAVALPVVTTINWIVTTPVGVAAVLASIVMHYRNRELARYARALQNPTSHKKHWWAGTADKYALLAGSKHWPSVHENLTKALRTGPQAPLDLFTQLSVVLEYANQPSDDDVVRLLHIYERVATLPTTATFGLHNVVRRSALSDGPPRPPQYKRIVFAIEQYLALWDEWGENEHTWARACDMLRRMPPATSYDVDQELYNQVACTLSALTRSHPDAREPTTSRAPHKATPLPKLRPKESD